MIVELTYLQSCACEGCARVGSCLPRKDPSSLSLPLNGERDALLQLCKTNIEQLKESIKNQSDQIAFKCLITDLCK